MTPHDKTLRQVFNAQKSHYIDIYQREFEWTEKNTKTLLNDTSRPDSLSIRLSLIERTAYGKGSSSARRASGILQGSAWHRNWQGVVWIPRNTALALINGPAQKIRYKSSTPFRGMAVSFSGNANASAMTVTFNPIPDPSGPALPAVQIHNLSFELSI